MRAKRLPVHVSLLQQALNLPATASIIDVRKDPFGPVEFLVVDETFPLLPESAEPPTVMLVSTRIESHWEDVTQLRLPTEKPSMERFERLGEDDRNKFIKDLLEIIWKCDQEGSVPEKVGRLIRAWVAHIRFEENPEIQARKKALRERLGGGT